MTATTLQSTRPPVTPQPLARPAALARIVSVTGSQAVAVLEPQPEPRSPAAAQEVRVHVGSLIRIATPGSTVIGSVTGLSVPTASMGETTGELRLVELDLVGEVTREGDGGTRQFKRGITNLPSLGDALTLATPDELGLVYAPGGRSAITIGHLCQNERIPARVAMDDLLGKHFAVVGTTGSGKSCAVTCILQQVLVEHQHAHILVLDMHNEYSTAFGTFAECINPANLYLPFWLMNLDEIVEVLVNIGEYRDAEIAILYDAILSAKRRYSEGGAMRLTGTVRKAVDGQAVVGLDTPTPFRLSDVIAHVDEQLGKLERTQNSIPLRRLKSRIEQLTMDPRYAFMFGGITVQDDMSEVLGRLFRVPANGKPITVLDLSAVPSEILNVVISVICRMTFDIGVWSQGQLPITLVCEEAHRYAPHQSADVFQSTRRELAKIAKEGRKYGISLGLVSQRPSEIDPTILSQCNTMFAMRLTTEADQKVCFAAASDGAMNLLELLPSLGDCEAVVIGQGVPLPMRIRFQELEEGRMPRSQSARFSSAWRREAMSAQGLDKIVERWRLNKRDNT
ncbi:MAG: ATP-binding protein [Alphaproteobacteria bacterium]|nr:ATP-binding protein [Alphaproteobacteria bacterium]